MDLICVHCLYRAAEPLYVCDECKGGNLCLRCAKEAGLFGMDLIVKERRDAARQARQAANERKFGG